MINPLEQLDGPNRLWYRKDPKTVNGKLRQAIMDLLPDIDKRKADLILRAIFYSMFQGAIRDGRTTVKQWGSINRVELPERWQIHRTGRGMKQGQFRTIGMRKLPARIRLKFLPSEQITDVLRGK